MKWKSLLTVREASFIGAGLVGLYSCPDDLNEKLRSTFKSYNELEQTFKQPFDWGGDFDPDFTLLILGWDDLTKVYNHWMGANQIKESLVHDLQCIIDGSYVDCPLEITSPVNFMELTTKQLEDVECSKVSFAKWFAQHDFDTAKMLYPAFTEEMFSQTKVNPNKLLKLKAPALAPKSENAYARTVKALAEALVGELTGKNYADAETIAAALASKGVEPPVCKRVLAGYLEKAG